MEQIYIMTSDGLVDISQCLNVIKITFSKGCPQQLILPHHRHVIIHPADCVEVSVFPKLFFHITYKTM